MVMRALLQARQERDAAGDTFLTTSTILIEEFDEWIITSPKATVDGAVRNLVEYKAPHKLWLSESDPSNKNGTSRSPSLKRLMPASHRLSPYQHRRHPLRSPDIRLGNRHSFQLGTDKAGLSI